MNHECRHVWGRLILPLIVEEMKLDIYVRDVHRVPSEEPIFYLREVCRSFRDAPCVQKWWTFMYVMSIMRYMLHTTNASAAFPLHTWWFRGGNYRLRGECRDWVSFTPRLDAKVNVLVRKHIDTGALELTLVTPNCRIRERWKDFKNRDGYKNYGWMSNVAPGIYAKPVFRLILMTDDSQSPPRELLDKDGTVFVTTLESFCGAFTSSLIDGAFDEENRHSQTDVFLGDIRWQELVYMARHVIRDADEDYDHFSMCGDHLLIHTVLRTDSIFGVPRDRRKRNKRF